jgi:hypothetical protein
MTVSLDVAALAVKEVSRFSTRSGMGDEGSHPRVPTMAPAASVQIKFMIWDVVFADWDRACHFLYSGKFDLPE